MTTEHLPLGQPAAGTADVSDRDAARRALRVQLLTTEHWSLLATRSLSWNESFARAGMFLTLLTGTVVALALVAQATAFGQAFAIFALLLLPVVLFVGCATFVRLGEINDEDVVWVQGMNRLRRAYLELDPGIEPYLITGWTEDVAGVLRTYGTSLGTPSLRENLMHALVTTPAMIAFVNCVVAAVLVGLVLAQLGAGMELSAIGAAVGFVVGLAVFALYSARKAKGFWLTEAGQEDGD
jgi:ABC-type transport system involved in cytochrome bd biosynthesis fused ATPase/permease subunit